MINRYGRALVSSRMALPKGSMVSRSTTRRLLRSEAVRPRAANTTIGPTISTTRYSLKRLVKPRAWPIFQMKLKLLSILVIIDTAV